MGDEEKKNASTPYDDAFRTLTVDCPRLLISVINEVFDKHYTGDEEIVFHPNEHFMDQQDGAQDKIITDSSFSIIGETEENISVRMSVYAGQQYAGQDISIYDAGSSGFRNGNKSQTYRHDSERSDPISPEQP